VLDLLGYMAAFMVGMPLLMWASMWIYTRMDASQREPKDVDSLRAQVSDLERRLKDIESKLAT
jgi:hypothetical protein